MIEGEVLALKQDQLDLGKLPEASKSTKNMKQKLVSGGFGKPAANLLGSH